MVNKAWHRGSTTDAWFTNRLVKSAELADVARAAMHDVQTMPKLAPDYELEMPRSAFSR